MVGGGTRTSRNDITPSLPVEPVAASATAHKREPTVHGYTQ